MVEVEQKVIRDVSSEMCVVGSFFINPDLFLDYGALINPTNDFPDGASKFLYESLHDIYHNHTTKGNINEAKISMYMSADEERKARYKEFGGYARIKQLVNAVDIDDFETHFKKLKKYTLLRHLREDNFPVERIMNNKAFERMSAEEIVKSMEFKLTSLLNDVGGVEDSIMLGKDLPKVLERWKTVPDMGIPLPFPTVSFLIRGIRKKKLMLLGLHSGQGKSRITSKIVAYIGLLLKENILVAVNEQDKDEWDAMILSAVVNNPEFGFGMNDIDETKIVTGAYDAREKEILDKAAKWIAENTRIHFLELKNYDEKTIKRQVKRHSLRGCKIFVYDTLKSPDLDWKSFVRTGRMLKEIAQNENMACWATFQLTDDSLFDELLTSKAIASGKHIKHDVDHLFMAKMIQIADYEKYKILNPHGLQGSEQYALKRDKNYMAWFMDKNRGGADKDVICFEVDKGKNRWIEHGFLISVGKRKKDEGTV